MLPALIVGAGPAGLAASRELAARGVEHLVLERGAGVGHSWANAYDSLTLHTGKHMSGLPGMPLPRSAPLFVTRQLFCEYLEAYARRFALPVVAECTVTRAERAKGVWRVTVRGGATGSAAGAGAGAGDEAGEQVVEARALVVATGIMANPRVPELPGRARFGGRVIHSVEYRRPEPYVGRRVLVVGVGNSGGEIGSELARAGAHVTLAVRSGANVVPLTLLGLPIQYVSYWVRKLPRAAQEAVVEAVRRLIELRRGPPVLPRSAVSPLDAIPLIGFHLVDAIRAGLVRVRGAVGEMTEWGVRFAGGADAGGAEEPFDDVILATGFAPALGFLGALVRADERGFALRRDRVASADQPDLYFVGHNYDATGGLWNIARDAPVVAERIAEGGRRKEE